MSQARLERDDVINLAGALLNLLRSEHPSDLNGIVGGQTGELLRRVLLEGPEDISNKEMQRSSRNSIRSQPQQNRIAPTSHMTVAEFIENKFVPEHVALMRSSGRAHYKSIMKHILRPEEVDRMFRGRHKESRKKLEAVPGWPYLSNVRLCDARPDHVSRLISAALARGYSGHTVVHIRNVAGAIFSHAKREQCLLGDNPVSLVKPPAVRCNRSRPLTLAQAEEALILMKYPEREMTLLSIFSGMNITEILGLQWKHVNLTEVEFNKDGTRVAPRTIAVRNQLYRGHLESVKKNRVRNLPIPEPLLRILLKLRGRGKFIAPDDFVFVSRAGTPVNQNNLLARRIRPIARRLGVPSLSCQAFRRIGKILAAEFGKRLLDVTPIAVGSVPLRDARVHRNWHCRIPKERMYTGNESALPPKFARTFSVR